MKYSPSLAYRGTQWLIATFTHSPERTELIATLSLLGALAAMFTAHGIR